MQGFRKCIRAILQIQGGTRYGGGVLLFSLLLNSTSHLQAQTKDEFQASISAERWMTICRPILDSQTQADGTITVSTLPGNEFEAGRCMGALDAISVLASLVSKGTPVLGMCPPPEHTAAQWASIFTDYLRRHPKRYGEPFAFVMVAALQEAHPCRQGP